MENNPIVFLITGLSGAGKTFLLRSLEDEGYYTVDNVPPHLIKSFLDVTCTSGIEKLALVSDIRWKKFNELTECFINIKKNSSCDIRIKKVFLDADTQTIIDRFKKSRRNHPLDMPLEKAIEKERDILNEIKNISDIIIDTSNTEPSEFRKKFFQIINENKRTLKLKIISFGFKNGIPRSADYIFDVRFLPNPFYFYKMYKLTGLDDKIKDYLESFKEVKKTVDLIYSDAKFIQEQYGQAGRIEAVYGIGCTGGKHRSVYIAQKLYEKLKAEGKDVSIEHRDINKE
ncbi:nucleotide-binding protein [Tepiditoga spiralis]|uniref:Nucleotide-binding protein n=1 Tax=Tepiditoga spiralis TaxID=2108365 RepID=A0A7G1GAE8_9BACT|nr:RNase adapter RapZ [Tepiditoga spiralis]BBE30439.1 nucleotide-binding protein [Tepiditoga spiralis]